LRNKSVLKIVTMKKKFTPGHNVMQTTLPSILKNLPTTGLISTISGSIKAGFLSLLCSSAVFAADKVDLDQLMLSLSKVDSSNATFVETKTMKLLKKPLILTGQLVYKAPDYLQKKIISPTASTYTINGQQVKAEEFNKDSREFSLDESILLQALVESLRATLAGNLDTLKDFYEVSVSGTHKTWTLDLEPIDDEIKLYIKTIKIMGQNTSISRIETVESNNDRSVMTISDITKSHSQL